MLPDHVIKIHNVDINEDDVNWRKERKKFLQSPQSPPKINYGSSRSYPSSDESSGSSTSKKSPYRKSTSKRRVDKNASDILIMKRELKTVKLSKTLKIL